MSNVIEVTDENFEKEVRQSQVPVVVDFGASWCGPCKMLAPVFDELANEYAGQVKFAKVDVDDAPEVAGEFAVRSVPTLVLIKAGTETARVVGAQSKSGLKTWVDQVK